MPRIDSFEVKNKTFKKKAYRSWDGNLFEKLKLPKNTEEQNFVQEQIEPANNLKSGNSSLSGHKEFNEGSNKAQLASNKGSISVHKELNEGSNKAQLASNKGLNLNEKIYINRVQIEFETSGETISRLIRKLGGNEKKLFFLIINLCSIKGSLSTGDLLGDELNQALSTTRNGRETAIKRLVKKGLIKRRQGKTGSNGTLNFHVSDLIKSEALNFLNLYYSEHKLLSNYSSNELTSLINNKVHLGFNNYLYNSSSSNNINTTTNRAGQLPEEWKAINIEPLQEHGFSLTQLKQLYVINITSPEIVQESINHFAFGLKNNPKFSNYKDPLNVLMGVLRKGEAWHEKDYKSPKELTMERIIEQKRAEEERIKKLEEQIFLTALEEWKKTKSEEELNKLLPAGNIPPRSVKISLYFKENIWSTLKNDYSL
ncbi:hypothetical protein [Rickettsiella massiliensis]|uniref:hypothetical protein n=1 Tax=Rickettsiella massiliensis TaxID=676517 RepID=UPI00029A10A0|nr:hypothetical protein [Rickettsiella massiliensis]